MAVVDRLKEQQGVVFPPERRGAHQEVPVSEEARQLVPLPPLLEDEPGAKQVVRSSHHLGLLAPRGYPAPELGDFEQREVVVQLLAQHEGLRHGARLGVVILQSPGGQVSRFVLLPDAHLNHFC